MNTVDLPEDLLVEILSRVPESSLARFRSISKEWNALIKKEERLAKKSLIIMLIDFRVYLASFDMPGSHDNVVKVTTTSQFSLKDPLSKSSKEVDIRNVFHCDGLLLCTTEDRRLVVWNPRSGESSWIKPRGSYGEYGESDIYALGKSSCNRYKILRMHESCLTYALNLEIYDLTSNSWRRISNTTSLFIPKMWSRGTSVSGNTYWLAQLKNDFLRTRSGHMSLDGETLLGFDFTKERFGRVSLPGDCLSDRVHVRGLSVTREEQQLCLLTTQRSTLGVDTVDLWRATKIESLVSQKEKKKIDDSTSWSKFLSVKTDQTLNLRSWSANFLADRENQVLVYRGGEYLLAKSSIHIMGKDKDIQVMDHHDAGSQCSQLVSYMSQLWFNDHVPDLFLINRHTS